MNASRWPVLLSLLAATSLPVAVQAEGGDYRVEVLVFRHLGTNAEPLKVDSVRSFHDAFRLEEITPPEVPVPVSATSTMFEDLWRRLQRQAQYKPLVSRAWQQTRIDYHPPVRVHDAEVIAEELYFPGEFIYVELSDPRMFDPFVAPLYRLDGTVQLRRSRFLHVDIDLEFRVDDPAWDLAFPPLDRPGQASVLSALPGASEQAPEPFRIHRLKQSRQVRTDALNYFDSEFLGVLVRVTAIDGPGPTQDQR